MEELKQRISKQKTEDLKMVLNSLKGDEVEILKKANITQEDLRQAIEEELKSRE